jgi:hypothetical protein
MMPVKTTEPKIDQTTGKLELPIRTTKKSGKANFLAIHSPTNAPIKPKAIETTQPPCEYPTIDCPIDPQIPAIISSIKKSMSDMKFLSCLIIS